uniref:USP domain-containing protein n=1 Tax=Arcella intermedia TaxID=1963864 RepID=A0A6B2KWJ0_9EUKA
MFALLQKGDQAALSTENLTQSFKWESWQTREQHDVHELNRVLFDAIERSLAHTSGKNLLQSLYNGVQVNKIICRTCLSVSERTETFQDIGIPVYHYNGVEESFMSIVTPEPLVGDNQYFCDTCLRKVDADRSVTFRKVPPILNLCLGRFEYNISTGNRVKNSRVFRFPLVLDVHPYTEEGSPAVTGQEFPVFVGQESGGNQENAENEEKDVEKQEPLVIGDSQKSANLYDLCDVIIHVGSSAGHGHYHSYIRDFLNEGNFILKDDKDEQQTIPENYPEFGHWYDFNDSMVTPIPTEKISTQYGGKSECAYMLVYRSRSLQTVREVVLPENLAKLVEEHNATIEKERFQIKEKAHKIKILVSSEEKFRIDSDGRLIEKEGQEMEGEGEELNFFDLYNEETIKQKTVEAFKEFEVDLRDKVSQFLSFLSTEFKNVPALTNIHLHRVFDENKKIHILKPLLIPDPQTSELSYGDLTLKDIGLHSKMKIFVWNGQSIQGVPFKTDNFKFNLPVAYSNPDKPSESLSLVLPISEYTTLKEIKDLLQITTKLVPAEQNLLVISQSDLKSQKPNTIPPKKKGIPLRQSDELNAFDLRLEGCWIWVDKFIDPANSAETTANVEESSENPTVFVTVLDYASGSGEKTFEVDKGVTLQVLKVMIISLLNLSVTEDAVVLRRCNSGTPGGLYTNEKLTVDYVQLAEFGEGTVIIEMKDTPTEWGYPVSVEIEITGLEWPSPVTIMAVETWTIEKLKSEVAQVIKRDPSQCRLYAKYWKSRKLVTDEGQTLKKAKIVGGDTLWLQEGPAPLRAQITINFDLYTPSFTVPTSLPAKYQNMYSPLLHLSSWNNSLNLDNFSVTSLSTKLDFSATEHRLKDVKETLRRSVPMLSELAPPPQTRLRIWHKQRLLKPENATLKQLYLTQDTSLTVQIVQQDTEEEKNPNLDGEGEGEGVLLYVHHRQPGAGFQKPIEWMFGGLHVEELVNGLVQSFQIPKEVILVARFQMYKGYWEIIYNGSKEVPEVKQEVKTTNKKPKKTKKQRQRQKQRQKHRPFLIDGSLIAIQDLRLDPTNSDSFAVEAANFNSSLHSMYQYFPRGTKEEGRANWKQAPEVGLRIDVSDEEYSYEEITDEEDPDDDNDNNDNEEE